ncbi:hypothetical protein D3C73_1294760 [compost metagenome]
MVRTIADKRHRSTASGSVDGNCSRLNRGRRNDRARNNLSRERPCSTEHLERQDFPWGLPFELDTSGLADDHTRLSDHNAVRVYDPVRQDLTWGESFRKAACGVNIDTTRTYDR